MAEDPIKCKLQELNVLYEASQPKIDFYNPNQPKINFYNPNLADLNFYSPSTPK